MGMQEVWIPSPNYSSRGGSSITTVVLHTTEGAMKIRDLGNYFASSSVQASSHHGADNYERGVLGAYVYEQNKAWTQANANPWCLSLEMCAYASWSRDTWLNSKGTLLHNAADWVAWMCGKYGIPIRALSNADAQNPNVKGVCQHVNLGSAGGGHSDCGGGFPMDQVLKWASGSSPTPSPQQEADMSASVAYDLDGRAHYACVWSDGKINYRPPGGSWGACDSGQTGAKSGAGIGINLQEKDATKRMITILYTNGSGKVCAYSKPVKGGKWAWSQIGDTNAK